MRFLIIAVAILTAGAALFLFLAPQTFDIRPNAAENQRSNLTAGVASNLPVIPESDKPSSSEPQSLSSGSAPDISNQGPLTNPPSVVKAIYVTGWSAGSEAKMNSLISLIKRTELNAVVIDIKDYSGFVSYKTGLQEVASSGAENQLRINRPNALIKKLHDENIYIIGRITVFQDPLLAKAHPEWALKNITTGKIWTDKKGLAWMDPVAEPVWEYNLAIAKDALGRGFDEVNFDYIRFASDGDVEKISYPFWDGKTTRHKTIRKFFSFLRENLGESKISADLFGLSTVNTDDMGIGQTIEDAYAYFDYVSPMVYPSHYAPGFIDYENPAEHPYEVIRYSLEHALARLKNLELGIMNNGTTTSAATSLQETLNSTSYILNSKLRPWLQDFDLGANYNAVMVKKEIQAVDDVLLKSSSSNQFVGWLLWDPANIYTEAALEKNNL